MVSALDDYEIRALGAIQRDNPGAEFFRLERSGDLLMVQPSTATAPTHAIRESDHLILVPGPEIDDDEWVGGRVSTHSLDLRDELAREREQNLEVSLRCSGCGLTYDGEVTEGEPEACVLCGSEEVGRA